MSRESERATTLFALLLSGLAAVVLLGWFTGVRQLASWGDFPCTKPLTAACFLVLALRQLAARWLPQSIRAWTSGTVAAIGLIVVLQHVTSADIRVLDWLAPTGSVPDTGASSFRMTPTAALSLMIAGAAMTPRRGLVVTVARLAAGALVSVVGILAFAGFDLPFVSLQVPSPPFSTIVGLLLLSGMLIAGALGRGVPLPLYAALALMLGSTLLPAMFLALSHATSAAIARRQSVEAEGRDAASRAALFVERFVADRAMLLRVLAASPALQANDLAAFYEHAKTLAALPDSAIVVIDRSINQVMSTAVPFGTRLPPVADPATARRVFDTQVVDISDLFFGPFNREPIISTVAPVPGNAYVLRLTTSSRWLSEQLQREASSGWVLTVVDRQGTIVARSLDAERMVGFKVPIENWNLTASQRAGYFSRAKGSRHYFLRQLSSVGWSTVAFAEARSIDQSVRSPLQKFGVGLLAMVGLAVLIAWLATGILAGPIKGLAATVTSDADAPPAPSLIIEINAVAEAWHDAALTRKAHEKALHERRQLEALGRLTGGVAHDFNNILSLVDANLELIELRVEDEEVARYIAEVKHASQMGARLNRRLMTFAQRRQLELELIDLNDFVRSTRELLSSAVGAIIAVEVRLGASQATTRVDVSELENSIVNLALNARDAMPSGGTLELATYDCLVDAVEAEMRGIKVGQYVQLSVSDTGTGMTEEVRSKAFVPFFTTKVGHVAGLGLAAVHGFVKQSGGDITIESQVGKGTTVVILLPVAAEILSMERQSSEVDSSDSENQSGANILHQ